MNQEDWELKGRVEEAPNRFYLQNALSIFIDKLPDIFIDHLKEQAFFYNVIIADPNLDTEEQLLKCVKDRYDKLISHSYKVKTSNTLDGFLTTEVAKNISEIFFEKNVEFSNFWLEFFEKASILFYCTFDFTDYTETSFNNLLADIYLSKAKVADNSLLNQNYLKITGLAEYNYYDDVCDLIESNRWLVYLYLLFSNFSKINILVLRMNKKNIFNELPGDKK